MIEWAARTYGYSLPDLLWQIPAAQVALLLRQWTYAVAGSKAITLNELTLLKETLP